MHSESEEDCQLCADVLQLMIDEIKSKLEQTIKEHTININFSYEIVNTGIQDEININFQNG